MLATAERLMKPLGYLLAASYDTQYLRAQSSDLVEVGLRELSLRKGRGDSLGSPTSPFKTVSQAKNRTALGINPGAVHANSEVASFCRSG